VSLRVLIVDDEKPARQRLEDLVDAYEKAERIGSAATGHEAVEAIQKKDPDVVLLDIQMPGLNGLDVVQKIGPRAMPVTIFVTAYDQHALEAFDVAALDYLLKPFEDERFKAAMDRAYRQVHLETVERLRGRLVDLLEEVETEPDADAAPAGTEASGSSSQPSSEPSAENGRGGPVERSDPEDGYLQRIPVRKAKEVRVIAVETVTYFEAEGPYVELHTDDGGRHLIRERMKTLEAQLDPANFCRIHRSTIVNLNFVDAVQPNYEDRYVVVLSTGERLDVSRRRRERFENRFGLSF
jgi:two-component system LytT family response regulator